MKNLAATRPGDESLRCYACGRAIADGNWFARIKQGGGHIVFCRPWCVEVFLEATERRVGGLDARRPEGR